MERKVINMKNILKIICIFNLLLLTACSEINTEKTEIEKTANKDVNIEEIQTDVPAKDGDILDTKYLVEKVVDGDTFIMNNGRNEVRVRLIGIDTPESVAPEEYLEKTGKENTEEGKNASDFTKSLIEDQYVYLEFDAQQEDKYGRLLAYVYLEDGRMLQDILITEGYAELMTIPPNVKYADRFAEEINDVHQKMEVK